jgi:feruloyl-CoA synthase
MPLARSGRHCSIAVSLKRPVLILSGNGIEHGLLALACLNVGIPFVPVSTAYSLVSTDFARLRDIAALVQPGLVFADDGDHYAAALLACTPKDAEVVIARGNPDRRATFFDAMVATTPTDAVESAANAVNPIRWPSCCSPPVRPGCRKE